LTITESKYFSSQLIFRQQVCKQQVNISGTNSLSDHIIFNQSYNSRKKIVFFWPSNI